MAGDAMSELFRLRRRVQTLEDTVALMGQVWDSQRARIEEHADDRHRALLDRIYELEEQCQTNTETKPNTTSSSTPGQGKQPTSMRSG